MTIVMPPLGPMTPARPSGDRLAVEPPARPLDGMVRFIRYGFMPNRLRYCGGDENRLLFDHAVEQVVDGGLQSHLQKFTGALPYLQLIARANGIGDPFDPRVVDAYWIGNGLLDHVEVRQLYDTTSGARRTGARHHVGAHAHRMS